MFELFEIWRNSQSNSDRFLDKVRAFSLECADIFTPIGRTRYGVYWKQQHDELREMIKEHGADVVAENDFKRFKLMQDFSHRVGNVLENVADILQPRSFAEWEENGFDELDLK